MRRTLDSIVPVVCLIALGTVVVSAQPSGQLTGVVRDATGGVLSGVTMSVTGPAQIAARTVVTDEHGEYVVDALPAGRYLVTAAFSGFEPSSTEIEVGATTATLDVELTVSSLAERVTVTATRTGASDVQSTPGAMTVLPARTLEQLGVTTVEGLAGVVPSVTMSQHTGLAQVTIRGIGSNSTFGDPSSTVHLDGVYLGRPAMVFADFLNVERVEVLRGPQGTLYGRNSVGGTINIVTRQPTNTLETSVRLTAGNYHTLRAEAAVSGPLIKNKVMGNFAFLRGTRAGATGARSSPCAVERIRHLIPLKRSAALARQLPLQPGFGKLPVPHHGLDGHTDRFGRFLQAQPAEEAQFHHAALPFIHCGQRVERFIELHHVARWIGTAGQGLVERDPHHVAAPFLRA